jgi:hypothetical protein
MGISVAYYKELAAKGCGICGETNAFSEPGGVFQTDRDYTSKVVGLLCSGCKLVLTTRDSQLLRKAANYLDTRTREATYHRIEYLKQTGIYTEEALNNIILSDSLPESTSGWFRLVFDWFSIAWSGLGVAY